MADANTVTAGLATLGGSGWTPTNDPRYGGPEQVRRATWATLPAPSSVAGQIFRVTDIGISGVGVLVISDGTSWVPLGPQVLARKTTPTPTTGDTNENALWTVPVPAGAMGLNGGLLIYSTWSHTNSANTKTERIRLGGAAGTQFMAIGNTTTASFTDIRRIRNRGAANSQMGGASTTGQIGGSGNAMVTAAIDTSVAQDLVFSGQNGLGTETITLEGGEVWLVP